MANLNHRRKITFVIILLCWACLVRANDSSRHYISINFLYGSKPAKGYKQSESKVFGGLKGGHVNIEAGGRVLDFIPGKNPLLPKNKNPSGGFQINSAVFWNKTSDKWVTVIVPVTPQQYSKLQVIFDSLSSSTPYDYAIFGMRCAAASYDVLSMIGLFKEIPDSKNISRHFYPKLLRKKILDWAGKNNFTILRNEGKPTRKWESDKGLF